MVTDEQVRRIALFFLLAVNGRFNDGAGGEKLAIQAAQKAVAHLKAVRGRSPSSSIDNVELIRLLHRGFQQVRSAVYRNKQEPPMETEPEILSPRADLETWMRFHKEASEQEMLAVILGKVLGFDDQEIADGLKVSIGTARYRIGKGIRQLGSRV